jgi:hypothetical protein
LTIARCRSNGMAETSASRVPSPPSAIGQQSTTASGTTFRIPAAIDSAAVFAVTEPLKLSGAQMTFTSGVYRGRGRPGAESYLCGIHVTILH